MDLHPFTQGHLEGATNKFIARLAQEPGAPPKLRIYLDQLPTGNPKELINAEVHINSIASVGKSVAMPQLSVR
jgi:hypothetical protein